MKYPKIYGFADAAKFLGVSREYFLRLINQGKIYFQKTCSGRMFFEPDLIKLKNERVLKSKKDRRVRIRK